MEAFLFGVSSVLSLEIGLYIVFSFILIGKLSNFFGSHLAKVVLLSVTAILLFSTFLWLSPATTYIILQSSGSTILITTLLVCSNLLGVFKSIKSDQLRVIVEGVFNWVAPILFGFWFFLQSFQVIGPLMASQMMHPMSFESSQEMYLIPLLFGLGLVLVVSGLLLMSWFFHNKFREMQFWKIIQVLTTVAVMIFSLRFLIELSLY